LWLHILGSLLENKMARSTTNMAGGDLKLILGSHAMWVFVIFLFFSSIPQSFRTPLYYYQRDALSLSDLEIGYLKGISGVGGLISALAYPFLTRRFSMQGLLVLGTLGPAVGIAAFVFYNSFATACVIELLRGFLFGIGGLAMMHGAVILTSASSAAFGFAIFMSALNAGVAIGDYLAALLVEHLPMTLLDIVVVFTAIAAACSLGVFFLPRSLLSCREAHPASPTTR
jgi:hypothetical protein